MEINFMSSSLVRSDDGIWYQQGDHSVSFPAEGNTNCFLVEDESFWFKHRNSCIIDVIKKYPPNRDGFILDVGGGNGYVSLGLQKVGFQTVLVEPGEVGVRNARMRGVANIICATFESADFSDSSIPAVGLFDVVEHIENDLKLLCKIHKVLVPEGRVYITVPSYNFLWSDEDVAAGHYRRYKLPEINRVLRAAGFEIEYATYFFKYLIFPILLIRVIPYRLGIIRILKKNNIDHHRVRQGFVSKGIDKIFNLELKSLREGKSIKFGASCLVVAKKPKLS